MMKKKHPLLLKGSPAKFRLARVGRLSKDHVQEGLGMCEFAFWF